jgi:hypothetical protein
MSRVSPAAACALVLCLGCGEERDAAAEASNAVCGQGEQTSAPLVPPTLANSVQLRTASGIDLGEGVVLTNWHVCTGDRRVLTYNVPLLDGTPYREGDPFDGCVRDDPARVAAPDVTCPRHGALEIAVHLDDDPARPPPPQTSSIWYETVFAQKALDLCILHRDDEHQRRPLPPPSTRVAIDTAPVHLGQDVVVAGHPRNCENRVVERCKVVRETALVRDPDLVLPSDVEVVSFAIDCKTVQHGSSGSPVLDATTGALLGLVWTGECVDLGECNGVSYVSAASAWRSAQGQRPVEQYSRLDELLTRFAGP